MILAVFIADLSLLVGFAVLLLPLLVTELSRPKDGFWGALILVLGLILITSSDRLSPPLLVAIAVGALLIARLGFEVGQSRWNQLSQDEKMQLHSFSRWTKSIKEFFAAFAKLGGLLGNLFKVVIPKPRSSIPKKKWVRPEKNDEQKSETTEEPSSNEQLHQQKDEREDTNASTSSKGNTP